MLCENDPNVRMRRYLRTWYDERVNYFRAQVLTVTPSERQDINLIEDWDINQFTPRVSRWDSIENPGKLRSAPIFRDCVRIAAEFVQAVRPDDAELLWRVASGYAHGRAWAIQETGKFRMVEAPPGQVGSQSTVDHEHLSKMIAFAALTIEYADWLVKERMGHVILGFDPFLDAPHRGLNRNVQFSSSPSRTTAKSGRSSVSVQKITSYVPRVRDLAMEFDPVSSIAQSLSAPSCRRDGGR